MVYFYFYFWWLLQNLISTPRRRNIHLLIVVNTAFAFQKLVKTPPTTIKLRFFSTIIPRQLCNFTLHYLNGFTIISPRPKK